MDNNVLIDGTQYIMIKLGKERFGIDIKYVDNIVRMMDITRVPMIQPYMKGVINLRGDIVPVMSTRIKLELEDCEATDASRIIIVKMEGNDTIGLIVDEVREVVTLTEEEIEKVSFDKDEKTNYVSSVGKLSDGLISILELNALLAE